MKLSRVSMLVVGSVLTACGGPGSQQLGSYPPAKIQTADDAKTWARMSAPNMYSAGYLPYSLAVLSTQFSDAGCPTRTDDGTTIRVSGGCTAAGNTWSGAVVYERARVNGELSDAGFGSYRYESFAIEGNTTCDGGTGVSKTTYDGTLSLTGTSDAREFKLDVRMANGGIASGVCAAPAQSAAYAYSGTANGPNERTTWNGSGRAGSTTIGVADVSTKDEVISSAECGSEAASGATTVTAGSTKLVITYDGATKCDTTSTVKWSLNGVDQGELTGVSCAAAPGGELASLALLGVALASWLRRRAAR